MKHLVLASLLLCTGCGLSPANPFSPDFRSERSCNFNVDNYGERLSWHKLPIQIQIHESFPTELLPALKNAMESWEEALGRPLFQVTKTNVPGPLAPRKDGVNMIYVLPTWGTRPENTAGITQNFNTGLEIVETDLLLNGQQYAFYSKNVTNAAIHMESLLAHELGHVLGLAHNEAKDSIMYYMLTPGQIKTKPYELDIQNAKCEY